MCSPPRLNWKWAFDKMLQNRVVSLAGGSLTATPASYDNEMENNISLRIRQLFAVRHTQECRISWQLLPLRCVWVWLHLGAVVHVWMKGRVHYENLKNNRDRFTVAAVVSWTWLMCDIPSISCCECCPLMFYRQLSAVSLWTGYCSIWQAVVNLLSGVQVLIAKWCFWLCCNCEAVAVQLSVTHTYIWKSFRQYLSLGLSWMVPGDGYWGQSKHLKNDWLVWGNLL